MNADSYQRVKASFATACRLDAEACRAFLDEQFGDEPELRAELEALLAEDRRTHHALDRSPLEDCPIGTLLEPDDGELPDEIAGYRVVGILGRGGMGIVYRAEQSTPRREVALKVLPVAATSGRRRRMLEHEAEILARLHHRGIAQVYAAGIADVGGTPRPYLVMELVHGTPVDRHARDRQLTLAERLDLVIRVCDAVQHAHQNGVVHRDLKPDNILVTDAGEPKVLDFGIARSLDSDIGRTTGPTQVHEVIGTLPYMSPEQLAADPAAIDTRSDVYALGVIAYELVAGRLPHDVTERSLPDAIRVLAESEPPGLGSVDRAWRGDLETIVHKALAKDPDRRYATARELADDLQRYLRDEAILARPPSTAYQLRKFARRHRGLVGSLAALFVVLIAGVIVTTSLQVEASESAKQARTNAAIAAMHAARLAAQRGRWQQAHDHYDEAEASEYPDPVEIAMGRIEAWEGDLAAPRALLEIKRLQERGVPAQHTARLLLLEGDLAVNRLLRADDKLDLVRHALGLSEEDPDALSPADQEYARALLAETAADVLEHLHRARAHDSFHRRANEMYGNVLLTAGRIDEARQFARVLTTIYPDDPATMVFAALAHALHGGDPAEAARTWTVARERLSDDQLAWLPLMFEAAGLLRRFDELQIDQLVEPDPARFGRQLLAEYGKFVLRLAPIFARSRRAAETDTAPRSGEIYFRVAPAVARAYRGIVVATFDVLPGVIGLRAADPADLLPMLAALETADTVLGDGMFAFSRGLYLEARGDLAAAAERFAAAADRPSIVVTPLAARFHELDATARLLGSTSPSGADALRSRAAALVDSILLDPALDEPRFGYLHRVAGGLSPELMLAVALQWQRRLPDSEAAAAAIEGGVRAASERR